MKLRILSDLHFEFHPDGGAKFALSLLPPADDFDVLIVAGDLADSKTLEKSLGMIAAVADPKPVIYVHGNHEYYGSNRYETWARTGNVAKVRKNVHWLREDFVTIDGRRFLGTTLWFPPAIHGAQLERFMNDFSAIKGFRDWVYDEHARSADFLHRNVDQGDIVITHHLPSWKSVSPRFRASALNCFFVGDVEALISHRQPALWIHGHTHDSHDYQIGETRVLCNPYGYDGHELNAAFDPLLTVEV